MTAKRNSPWFVAALILAGVIFVGEVVGVYFWRGKMVSAEMQLKLKQRDIVALERVEPAPTKAVMEAIASEVERHEKYYAELQDRLRGGEKAEVIRTTEAPAARTDAYIDLASYVKRMQTLSKKQGVGLASDERFGFKAHVNEGPEVEQIPLVFRQRQVLEYLLRELLAAGPEALDGVRRAMPETRGALTGKDGFGLESALSLQRPGYIDTLAFQISFRGETEVLRRWLNAVAKYELPVVVRAVEAEPMAQRENANPVRRDTGSLVLTEEEPLPEPLVRRSPSRFTVTLEYLELVAPKQGDGQ